MIIMANLCHAVRDDSCTDLLEFLDVSGVDLHENSSASLSHNLMNHVRRMGKLDPFLLDRNVRGGENL